MDVLNLMTMDVLDLTRSTFRPQS